MSFSVTSMSWELFPRRVTFTAETGDLEATRVRFPFSIIFRGTTKSFSERRDQWYIMQIKRAIRRLKTFASQLLDSRSRNFVLIQCILPLCFF